MKHGTDTAEGTKGTICFEGQKRTHLAQIVTSAGRDVELQF